MFELFRAEKHKSCCCQSEVWRGEGWKEGMCMGKANAYNTCAITAITYLYLDRCFWFLAFITARIAGRWIRCAFVGRCIRCTTGPYRMAVPFAVCWPRYIVVDRRCGRGQWWRTVALPWQRFCTAHRYSWSEWCRFSYGRHLFRITTCSCPLRSRMQYCGRFSFNLEAIHAANTWREKCKNLDMWFFCQKWLKWLWLNKKIKCIQFSVASKILLHEIRAQIRLLNLYIYKVVTKTENFLEKLINLYIVAAIFVICMCYIIYMCYVDRLSVHHCPLRPHSNHSKIYKHIATRKL